MPTLEDTAAQLSDLPVTLLESVQGGKSNAFAGSVVRKQVQQTGVRPNDRDFIAMHAAYRATGGIARGGDLARLLKARERGDFVSLAKLLVSGKLLGFCWHNSFWVPMFQFDLSDMSIRQEPQQVVVLLRTALDDWSLANWFAQSNSWLNNRRPVDLLESNLPAVLNAARADRFVAPA
jgi:hypothetical protein